MREILKIGNVRLKNDKRNYQYSLFECPYCKELEYGRTSIIEKLTEVIGNIYENKELLNETNK